jgi:hypothetical protein
MNITDLEMSIRSENALQSAGITTIEQLVALNFRQLQNLKFIGVKSISEICWSCIQLMNGELIAAAIAWEKKFPTFDPETIEKAQKYDRIIKIIEA